MNRPIPFLHCPTAEAKAKALRALYAQGWTLAGGPKTVEDALKCGGATSIETTYLYGAVPFYWAGSMEWWDRQNVTLTNSLNHFIAYVKASRS